MDLETNGMSMLVNYVVLSSSSFDTFFRINFFSKILFQNFQNEIVDFREFFS